MAEAEVEVEHTSLPRQTEELRMSVERGTAAELMVVKGAPRSQRAVLAAILAVGLRAVLVDLAKVAAKPLYKTRKIGG